MRVKCLAQEHNTMTRPGLEPGPLDPESSALTTRPPPLSLVILNLQLRNCYRHICKQLHSFFLITIYFIRISRLKFAKF